jgi:hypothetical protein
MLWDDDENKHIHHASKGTGWDDDGKNHIHHARKSKVDINQFNDDDLKKKAKDDDFATPSQTPVPTPRTIFVKKHAIPPSPHTPATVSPTHKPTSTPTSSPSHKFDSYFEFLHHQHKTKSVATNPPMLSGSPPPTSKPTTSFYGSMVKYKLQLDGADGAAYSARLHKLADANGDLHPDPAFAHDEPAFDRKNFMQDLSDVPQFGMARVISHHIERPPL